MPRYRYKAYDERGRTVNGEIEAVNEHMALQTLRAEGLLVFETTTATRRGSHDLGAFWRRLGLPEWDEFVREMAIYLQAGLPVEEGLRLIGREARAQRVRRLATAVHERLVGGRSLADSLEDAAAGAPAVMLAVIRAAERGGQLAEAFADLHNLLSYQVDLRRRVGSALIYPMVLIISAIVVMSIVATALVPALMPLFSQSGARPPMMLVFIAGATAFVRSHASSLALLALAIGILIPLLFSTARGRLWRDRMLLRLPLFGAIGRQRGIAVYAHTLGTLLARGVALDEAMRIAPSVVGNTVLRADMRGAVEAVSEGARLSDALARSPYMPDLALRFIRVGEDTGDLAGALNRLATLVEHGARQRLETMTTLIGPALTIAIGVLVGGIILTVMQAMLGINDLALR